MAQTLRARRTLLPITLLLGALLGTGPFVPHTLGAAAPSTAPGQLDVPGLAGWLGLALAVAALAMVAVARRDEQATKAAEAARGHDDKIPDADAPRIVDPLVAALRGPAAYAPDDLDARLTASTSATAAHPITRDAPPWVRRISHVSEDTVEDAQVVDRTRDPADPLRA